MRWSVTVFLLSILSILPAFSQTPSATNPPQKQAVEQIVHDYLLSHPEIIVQALQQAKADEQRQSDEQARQAIIARRSELLDDPQSPVGGNPHGDVTIVEFFDYRCPYCKAVEPAIETLLKQDPKLRIVYKEFPILGPPSVLAARVALTARKQGKYAAFHTAMMATKGESEIDDRTVLRVAQSVGLNLGELKQDIEAPEITADIRRNYDLADALNIRGTPGIIIGDQIADGAADLDMLKHMIAVARSATN